MAVNNNDTGDNDPSNSDPDNNGASKQIPLGSPLAIIIVRIAGRAASRGVTHSAHAARMTYCGLGSTFNNAPD